ncbi:MAG: hypothetical protein ACYSU2_08745 [Planctomycetota bacterium]|jgi:hypothetical protein
MRTDSRTTSRCRAVRPAVRRCFTAVVGALLLAVVANTATAHGGDRWPEHGSGRADCVERGGPGHRWFAVDPKRAQYGYAHGYAAGKNSGWRAGYDDALHGRRCNPVAYGSGKGRSHNCKRGYIGGYADAYDRGYQHGRRKRATDRRWHRAGSGSWGRSVYIRRHF